MVYTSGDWKAGFYFGQKLRIAIQRGNTAGLLGTIPHNSDEDYVFDAVI